MWVKFKDFMGIGVTNDENGFNVQLTGWSAGLFLVLVMLAGAWLTKL